MAKSKESELPLVSFSMTVETIKEVVEAFKPAIKEKFLRFTVDGDNLEIALDDIGNVITYVKGFDITTKGEMEPFYINIDVLKSLVATGIENDQDVTFTADANGGLVIVVGGTQLNMGLPSQYVEINTEIEDGEEEVILSDKVKALCDRLKVVKSSGATSAPVMKVGKTIEMGSNVSYSIIKEGHALEKLEFLTIPEFFTYFSNIYKFGGEVTIILGEKTVTLVNGAVAYKIRLIENIPAQDVSKVIKGLDTHTTVNKIYLRTDLNKLSIPISNMDSEKRNVKLNIKDNTLTLAVKDLSNRESFSDIALAKAEGDSEIFVKLDTLKNCIEPLEDDFDISWSKAAMSISDETQITLISAVRVSE